MERPSSPYQRTDPPAPPRYRYGLPLTEARGLPNANPTGITEDQIRAVVVEFYRRARRDESIGPVFEAHVEDWDVHLDRMTDFWSSALLTTGRYSGNPLAQHRSIGNLNLGHFDRWIELFEVTVHELCSDDQAEEFLRRALRMRDAMTRAVGLIPPSAV